MINHFSKYLTPTAVSRNRSPRKKEVERQRSLNVERWLKKKFREGFRDMKEAFARHEKDADGMVRAYIMTLILNLTLDHSRWQLSGVKQGTFTLPEHLVPHPLHEALYCIRCSLALFLYFTHVDCLTIYDLDYQFWICLLVLLLLVGHVKGSTCAPKGLSKTYVFKHGFNL